MRKLIAKTMMKKTTVAIIEVGEDYTERLETLTLDLPQDEVAAIDAAAEYVAGLGYVVIPGHCEYMYVSGPDADYVAVTIDGQAWKVDVHSIASMTLEDGWTVSDHVAVWPLIETIYGPTAETAETAAEQAYGGGDDYCITPAERA